MRRWRLQLASPVWTTQARDRRCHLTSLQTKVLLSRRPSSQYPVRKSMVASGSETKTPSNCGPNTSISSPKLITVGISRQSPTDPACCDGDQGLQGLECSLDSVAQRDNSAELHSFSQHSYQLMTSRLQHHLHQPMVPLWYGCRSPLPHQQSPNLISTSLSLATHPI